MKLLCRILGHRWIEVHVIHYWDKYWKPRKYMKCQRCRKRRELTKREAENE